MKKWWLLIVFLLVFVIGVFVVRGACVPGYGLPDGSACFYNSHCCSGYCDYDAVTSKGVCKPAPVVSSFVFSILNKKSVYNIGDSITQSWSGLPSIAFVSSSDCKVWWFVNGVPDNVGWDGYVYCGDPGLSSSPNTGVLKQAHCYGKTGMVTNSIQMFVKKPAGVILAQSNVDNYTINCGGISCKASGETCTLSTECCSGLTCLSASKCGTPPTGCKNANETCALSADCCQGLYCSDNKCKTNPTCLSELKITACQYAQDYNSCGKLEALGLVTPAECCSCLSMCCGNNTVSLNDFKTALIKGIQSYFTQNSVLTKDEIKDMIWEYLTIPNGVNVVDLNKNGHYSEKKLLDTYNKAKVI